MNFSLALDLKDNYTNVTNDTDTLPTCDTVDRESLTPEIWRVAQVTPGDDARLPLNIIVFVTGIPLNIFIIARVVYKKLHKQPTFTLLLSLAVADLLACLSPVLFNIIVDLQGERFRNLVDTDYLRCQLCKLSVFFIISNFAATLTLGLISIDRFIYFKFSINYDKICSRKKVVIAVVTSWVASVTIGIPPLAGPGDYIFASLCGFVFLSTSHLLRGTPYIIFTLAIQTIVVITLVVTNVWVLVIGCKQLHKNKVKVIGSQAKSSLEMRVAKREREIFRKQLKLMQIFGGILGIHIVTLIPAFVMVPILAFAGSIPPDLYTVALFALGAQAALHPLVESLFTPELRKVVTKCCRRGKSVKRESWMDQEL